MFFSFGKKKRKSPKKVKKGVKKVVNRKPPTRLIKACKKFHIKVTKKVGKHRVYKKVSLLKKLLKNKLKRTKKTVKRVKKHAVKRRFRFGNAATFTQPSNYGYNQTIKPALGSLSQSSQVATPASNINRPPGFGLDANNLPIYGVYRPFFTEQVPTMVGPNSIGFMGQPDGSLYPVGGPFSRYTSFGKKRKGGRKARFGNGGNPPLMQTAGGRFCSNNTGILGMNTTGLFPTSCMDTGSSPASAFGKRRKARFGFIRSRLFGNPRHNEGGYYSKGGARAQDKADRCSLPKNDPKRPARCPN